MDRREALLRAEERGWRELNGLIARFPREELERPDLTPEGWSVKDLMWHIACWCADCVRALDRIRAGTFTGRTFDEDVETVNRRLLEECRRLDLAAVRAAWHASRTLMVERFATLEPLAPEAEEWFEESGPLHYAKHLADLRASVERPR